MVYCTKCGTRNEDDATVCINCGALLHGAGVEERRYRRYWRYEGDYYRYRRRGGAMGALVLGVIILIIGFALLLSITYGVTLDWNFLWAIVLLLAGIWLLVRALLWHRKFEARR
ncbi:MAG: zinc-ribbon domain-containing protein [Candidatus Bathyarchaeota archaeon]|nr:zinc-ribbon domain-containing protein [Candidatus Bathyarchaeota archaeon]